MAFPTNSVLDNFDRSNTGPPPSASWSTIVAGHKILSDLLRSNASWSQCASGWNVATFGPDCEVFMTITTQPSSGGGYDVLARLTTLTSSTYDGYAFETMNAATDLLNYYRIDNGVFTQLGASINQAFASGDSIGLEVVGSTLTGYYKSGAGAWSAQATRTDTTYASAGYIGLWGMDDGTNGRMDNFGGGSLAAASGPSIPLLMAHYRRFRL